MQRTDVVSDRQGGAQWKAHVHVVHQVSDYGVSRISGRGGSNGQSDSDGAALLSSICFLLRMSRGFEEQGNYAECVKSAESALLLRHANAAVVDQALAERQRALQERRLRRAKRAAGTKLPHGSAGREAAGKDSDDVVALTDDGEVEVPVKLSHQVRDVVLRCNSYAVEALRHAHFDGAAFFLNRAMFLTDGDDVGAPTPLQLAGEVLREGGGIRDNAVAADNWWWRRILRTPAQTGAPSSVTAGLPRVGSTAEYDALEPTQDNPTGARTTAATAAALRACFQPTVHDQHLRLSLRAATLNHLGCLEQRRGRLRAAAFFLRMALQTEGQLEEAGQLVGKAGTSAEGGSRGSRRRGSSHDTCCGSVGSKTAVASTYLNLNTVLNELGQHAEAVQVCERVIPLLQQALLECASTRSATTAAAAAVEEGAEDVLIQQQQHCEAKDEQTRTATMLVVAYYSLGVSLERRGGLESASESPRWALQEAIQVSHRYHLVPATCRTIEQVMQALRRQGSIPAAKAEKDAPHELARNDDTMPITSATAPLRPAPPPPMHPSLWGTTGGITLAAHSPRPVGAMVTSDILHTHPSPHGGPASSMAPPPQIGLALSKAFADGSTRTVAPLSATLPGYRCSSIHGSPRPTLSSPGSLSAVPQEAWYSPFAATAPRAPPPMLAPLPNASVSGSVPAALPEAINFAATAPAAMALRPGSLAPPPHTLPPMRGSLPASSTSAGSGSAPSMPNFVANPLGRRTFCGTAPLHSTTDSPNCLLSERVKVTAPSGQRVSPRVSLSVHMAGVSNNSPTPLQGASGRLQAAIGGRQRNLQNAKSQQQKRQKSIVKRQQLEAAVADAAVAERFFQQLISDKEKAEVERRRRAAVHIQRMWRGIIARTWVSTLIQAAMRVQRVVRRFLVIARIQHALEAEERARLRALELAQQENACRILQARVRQFLRRLQIRREYRAKRARLYYAARTIQRGYRAFCKRRAALLAIRAEAHRREDEQNEFRRRVAARRIQHTYLEYRTKRAELDAQQARQQRVRAAIRIQAVVRGYLTRAWYAYYRVYRREQEVRSAGMQKWLVLIQSACRAICSAYYGQQRALQALLTMRRERRHRAATKLQCLWRRHVAIIRLERLQAEHNRLVRQAIRIQRWYRMRKQRRAFLVYRAEQQRIRAAVRVQRWLRACWQAAKARAFAAYHAGLLRQQQLERLQARAILVMQGCCSACLSDRLVASVRRAFQRQDLAVRVWQRVGRGFEARREMALERRAVYWVAVREREEAQRTAAACTVQRAWRCAAAKDCVERMRRQLAAASVITRAYRVYRARVQLSELRRARQLRVEDAAARRIQRALRGFLYRRRTKEMSDYYRSIHVKKMRDLRRQEAVTTIQAIWRGHITRKTVQLDRQEWLVHSHMAMRIQRMWRSRRARQQFHEEISQRIKERSRDTVAAVTMQSFWRKMMAIRFTKHLRLLTHQRLAATTQIQRWWRMKLAQRQFARRRLVRREEEALQLYYAMQWEKYASVVNAFGRARQAQTRARDSLRDQLLSQLTAIERHRFMSRHSAATKIQAAYRGHYERVYVRGLLAEVREEARRAAELEARQQRAATRIQCAYRRAKARWTLAALKQDQLERVLASHQEYLEKADPAEVVQELFWINTTYQQREMRKAHLREMERRRVAAASIQRAYRCYKSRQLVATAAELHQREQAVRLVQDYWRHYRNAHRIKERLRRQKAATRLQSHIRGWLVRRSWPIWRAAIEAERQEHILVQDVLDHAAIVIQCFWRRVEAQRVAERLRRVHEELHTEHQRHEAALLIQDSFRRYMRKRRGRL